jgi:hypothetical protein
MVSPEFLEKIKSASKMDILKNIAECSGFLASVGENHWSRILGEFVASSSTPPTERQIRIILSWYGGMGSFSDLLLCTANGHTLRIEEEENAAVKLTNYRECIYAEACRIIQAYR